MAGSISALSGANATPLRVIAAVQAVRRSTMTGRGAVTATLTNNFSPPSASAYLFLKAASVSGTFGAFNYPSNLVGLTVLYGAADATIKVINTLPVIPVVASQTNNELVTFTLPLNATDAESPPQTLTYVLTNSPLGATVSLSGVITWTPAEAQGPMTTNITVRVTDNGTPNLTTLRTFSIVVNEINTPSLLFVPATQTLNELGTLNVSASASDSDIPTNSLSFSLLAPPAGMTIITNTGAISWTPTEAQGPMTTNIAVIVTDLNTNAVNAQQLRTTNVFTVIVNELNTPPALTLPPSQTIDELVLYSATATATDADLPPNPLTFALVSGPAGLTVSPGGAITWIPSELQGPSNYTIFISVTDTNPPAVNAKSFSVTNSFTLTVSEVNTAPSITVPGDQTIHAGVALSLTASATDADLPTNTLAFAKVSGPTGLSVSGAGLITWLTSDANTNSTNAVLVRVFDNGTPSLSATGAFNVVVVSRPRFLPSTITGTNVNLTWTAIPATSYRLQFNTNLNFTNWTSLPTDVTAATNTAGQSDSTNANPRFYRVRVLP